MRRIKSVYLLFLIAPVANAEGRLFYTPSERAGLEQARLHHVTESKASLPISTGRPLTFNGVVLRSDGRDTHWINDRPISGSMAAPTYQGRPLKPGQTVVDGKIYEPHQIIKEALP